MQTAPEAPRPWLDGSDRRGQNNRYGGHEVADSETTPGPDATREYRKLLTSLAARADRLGSRDAESAAQESVKRSLADPRSRAALEYYFHEDEHPPARQIPDW